MRHLFILIVISVLLIAEVTATSHVNKRASKPNRRSPGAISSKLKTSNRKPHTSSKQVNVLRNPQYPSSRYSFGAQSYPPPRPPSRPRPQSYSPPRPPPSPRPQSYSPPRPPTGQRPQQYQYSSGNYNQRPIGYPERLSNNEPVIAYPVGSGPNYYQQQQNGSHQNGGYRPQGNADLCSRTCSMPNGNWRCANCCGEYGYRSGGSCLNRNFCLCNPR